MEVLPAVSGRLQTGTMLGEQGPTEILSSLLKSHRVACHVGSVSTWTWTSKQSQIGLSWCSEDGGWSWVWFSAQSPASCLPRATWFRDRASRVCRCFLLQLGACLSREPGSLLVLLWRNAEPLGRETELGRPPFTCFPQKSVSLIYCSCNSDPSLLWHRRQRPLSSVQEVFAKALRSFPSPEHLYSAWLR